MRKKFIVTLLVFMLISAACSSNSKKATLSITATNFSFDSATYTVPAGAQVIVKMTNYGDVAHVFSVLKQGEHVTPPYESKDEAKILWELVAMPGETRSGTFKVPTEPGKYDVICRAPGHLERGMEATLVVEEAKK